MDIKTVPTRGKINSYASEITHIIAVKEVMCFPGSAKKGEKSPDCVLKAEFKSSKKIKG